MNPLGFAVDKAKEFSRSTQDFFDSLLGRPDNSSRRNPVEILKRLQREVFSDLMKIRERQDKVERTLSFYKVSGGSAFQEGGTHVRGEVEALGSLLFMGDIDREHYDAVDRAGLRGRYNSRFTFETTVQQKDTLVVEFSAGRKGDEFADDLSGSALSLLNVSYTANLNDCLSAIAIPVGGKFSDFDTSKNSSDQQKKGLLNPLCINPPLLNQKNDAAIGLKVKKSNFSASIAQSVCGLVRQPRSSAIGHHINTFGQIVCQLPSGLQLSLLGLHQSPKFCRHPFNLGAFAIPVGFLRHSRSPGAFSQVSDYPGEFMPAGSIALKLYSDRGIVGWIQTITSNPKQFQWAVNFFDGPEDDVGWSASLSGTGKGPSDGGRIQADSYLKFNLGKKFSLTPGVTYVEEGDARAFGFTLLSNWSF